MINEDLRTYTMALEEGTRRAHAVLIDDVRDDDRLTVVWAKIHDGQAADLDAFLERHRTNKRPPSDTQ